MPIRDTFWNIPHWVELGQYILGLLTILVFSYGVIRHVHRWRKGQPERRTDQLGKRLLSVFKQAVVQLRTVEDAYAGVMHLTIFWGIFMLLFGTALATIDWDVTHLFFDFQFLKGTVYVIYEVILDIFGLLLFIGLGMAIYRRYIIRPQKLHYDLGRRLSRDDAYIIIMLVLITISGYLVEGLRIAVTEPDWARWSPVGKVIASMFTTLGDPFNQALHLTIWTSHILVSFILLASVPFTKLFHIIAGPLNIFYRSLEPKGRLHPARDSGDIGVKEWRDFTWKQILDFEACTRCGRCEVDCPANSNGTGLSPRDVVIKISEQMREPSNSRALVGDVVDVEEIWACTTCKLCSQVCPVFIDFPSSVVDMRRHLVLEGLIDAELQDALMNLGRYGNSFGQSPRMRAKWTQSIQLKIKDARREPVDYLWFVGDYASYSSALTEITQKTAEVFHKAGLDFGILYDGENNAGNEIRRVGEEGLYEMLVEKNMAAFEKSTFKTIITSGPHSYNTLKNEYPPEVNEEHQVLHYAELLDQLISSGQLSFSNKLGHTVTYQDPCYLGRYNGVYDAPRRVIEATGCELIEMPKHHERAICCGAGGGRIWMEEGEIKERPSESSIREAVALDGVGVLVVTCPRDVTMYRDAVKTTGHDSEIVVNDLIELVHAAR